MAICIIPARKNSKRIKNKNTKNFFGKPIIYYAIKTAKKSNLFSKVIVSTDCKKIATIAKKYGAEVPFIRSKKISDDYTNTLDVVMDTIKKISSENEKYHCCIYPTAVLIDSNDLKKSYNKIKRLNADYLIAVTNFEYPPQRSLIKKSKNWINFSNRKFKNYRSQDLQTLYRDTGSFYFYKTSILLKKKDNLVKKTTYFFKDNLKTMDINYNSDFKLAKLKYKLLKNKI